MRKCCIPKRGSRAREHTGRCPAIAGCGWCTAAISSSVPQRQGERWGAAPDPAGEEVPPRAPPLADGIRLIFQAVNRRNKENEDMPLPGRPALPAGLCASAQGKGWELSCRHRKFQAHTVCILVCHIAKAGPGTNRRQPPVADVLPAVRSTETSNLPCGELR